MRRLLQRSSNLSVPAIAAVAFVLAFVVRLYWVLKVQSPHAAVYSDMGGYVYRAEQLLNGTSDGDPRSAAFYPWGTHVLIAAEFAAFGRKSLVGIGVVHAFVGALPAMCSTLIAARLLKPKALVALVGVAVALWHPQITYAGFFMSELWYSGALLMASWLVLRHLEHRSGPAGALGAGVALATAFVVRPQVLLTCVFLAVLLPLSMGRELADRVLGLVRAAPEASRSARLWASALVRGLLVPGVRRWALLLAPLVIAIVGSSVRLHHLSGRIGVISENDALNRVFADTSVGKLESRWKNAGGGWSGAWYAPAKKLPITPQNTVVFEGYIGDPVILDRIRREHLQGVPLIARVRRAIENVGHLAWDCFPNPEEDFNRDPRRALLQRTFFRLTLWLVPLAVVGLWAMRRKPAGLVVIANLVTSPIVAALYFAEARHRVPYDPFLVIAATVGLAALVAAARWLLERVRGMRTASA